MNYVLAVVFAFSGIGGLIYGVETGVFIGLGLLPWQLIRIGVSSQYYRVLTAICALAGVIFFVINNMWYWLLAFVFICLYNLWGYIRFYGDKSS